MKGNKKERERERKKAAFKTDGRRNESKDKTVEKQHGTPPPFEPSIYFILSF